MKGDDRRLPRGLDEASGTGAATSEVAALVQACLARLDVFPLDPATDPATTWHPEAPGG
jgi:hypothetical protein